ncbi:hypothetical protein VDS18_07280 [Xanthomonas campestris pv. campestris]|nr:hypothetical protein [Xanthomonas campestris pv. campestris]
MENLANLTIKLLQNELSEQQFLDALGIAREEVGAFTSALVARAITDKNGSDLNDAEMIRFKFALREPPQGYDSELDYWHNLLLQDWHQEHEELISDLQMKADPSSIPYLTAAIGLKPLLGYLAYDDYGAYYKKCLWALQAIGTDEAIEVIRSCTSSSDPALNNEASYRLSRLGSVQ